MGVTYSTPVDEAALAEFLAAFMPFFMVFSAIMLILAIIASVRISKMGGSGVGYFFFGWIYIACSSKADEWKGFNKTVAVIVGLLTSGLVLSIYVLATLKPNKNIIEAELKQG